MESECCHDDMVGETAYNTVWGPKEMTVFITIGVVMAALMAWGIVTSRRERSIDRRHFATFLGFNAGITAVTSTSLALVEVNLHPHSMSPFWLGCGFVAGIIAIVSIPATFFAGLFSRGMRRVVLVSCSVVVSAIYLLGVAGHFGD